VVAGVSPAFWRTHLFAADTAASTAQFPNLPRNLAPVFPQYTCERLEMSSHGEKSRKAKTTGEKNKTEEQPMKTRNIPLLVAIVAGFLTLGATLGQVQGQMIGINVLLNQPPSNNILQDLGAHGQVLDVLPQINGVTLRARNSELSTIQALPYVAGANPDGNFDLASGANYWSLDAVNVTDFGTGRVVDYDGEGVYIAVIDSGLPFNWRAYFPEERIAVEYARGFEGGGGERGTVSSQPQTWERDTNGHGCAVTSVILGFQYSLLDPPLPSAFDGVAPEATVIPVKVFTERLSTFGSVVTRAIIYAADLKVGGTLGNAPLVINLSLGGSEDDVLMRAAIDYAIANGVVVVAIAGNEADAGMRFPGRYAPVISAGATGSVGEFPPNDPTRIQWILNDVAEGDPSQHFIAPFSAWELPGQDLDILAPGFIVPGVYSQGALADYSFWIGTSFASPHVAGIAALMLQKNPGLTTAQIEEILENTAFPLSPGCRNVRFGVLGPGHWPSWRWIDFINISFFNADICWNASPAGHGLVQADAALAATPLP
jgi:subtilisin family serine protease